MQYPTQCPDCSAVCMDTDSHCQRCGTSINIGWIRWLPGITSALFALLMALALHFAIPAQKPPDTRTVMAHNMTRALFIGASATFGAILGRIGVWLIKSSAKR